MAFSADIQEMLDVLLMPKGNVTSRKMFGGLCYMVNGKMFAIVFDYALVTKLPDDARAEAFQSAGAKPFEHTYGPFGQWTQFHCDDPQQASELLPWLERGYNYVLSTPSPPTRRRRQL